MSASTAAHPNPFLHHTYHASSSAIASASVIAVSSLASTLPPAKRRNAFHARVFNDELPARSYPRIRPLLDLSSSPTGIPVSTSPSTRLVINLLVGCARVVSRRVRIRFVPPNAIINSKSHSSHAFTRPRLLDPKRRSSTYPSVLHALSPRACATTAFPRISSPTSFRKTTVSCRNSDTTSARSDSLTLTSSASASNPAVDETDGERTTTIVGCVVRMRALCVSSAGVRRGVRLNVSRIHPRVRAWNLNGHFFDTALDAYSSTWCLL